MRMTLPKPKREAGFTILELMIASSIFSIVLLVIAAGILRFSSDYYKGVNATNTQTAARAVMSNITQHIQFGSVGSQSLRPNGRAVGYCINNTTYSYIPGVKVSTSTTGLVQANNVGCTAATLANVYTPTILANDSGTYQDLLGREMRVAQLQINPNANGSYTVLLKIAYGDTADMFVDASGANLTDTSPATNWAQAHCKSQRGQQYCAMSQLTTTVQQRLP